MVTGANSGIGYETALELARTGARVILACRDATKARVAVKHIATLSRNSEIVFYQLDLASFRSVRDFVDKVLSLEPKIHVLINNAGIACSSYQLTKDGYEMHFGVNHLGHFLLTILLLERIIKTAPARIINVTSNLCTGVSELNLEDINREEGYDPFNAYCTSKLANVLFTTELARLLEGSGVTVYAVDPGPIRTELASLLNSISLVSSWTFMVASLFFNSTKQGAQTSVYCATSDDVCKYSGRYYSECQLVELELTNGVGSSKNLWKFSEDATGVRISDLKLKKNSSSRSKKHK